MHKPLGILNEWDTFVKHGGPVRVGHTIPAGMGFIVIVLMIIFGGAAPSTCLFQETFTGILQ